MRARARRAVRAGAAVVVAAAVLLPAALPAAADTVRSREYWLEEYGITEAWRTTRGEGVRVAVIDSGVDGSHPDLLGAVVGGTDVSGAGDPGGQLGLGEVPAHGTLVATLLAGRGHTGAQPAPRTPAPSGTARATPGAPGSARATPGPSSAADLAGRYGQGPDGVVGVAPAAEILAVSLWIDGATSGPNPGGVSVDEQIPAAVRWAVDHGAGVINMSLGSTTTSWPQSWDDAFLYAEQNDVVVVAAAGNRAGGLTQVGAPATIPGVLAVAGLDRAGRASAESSSEGITIAVAAPSENLVGGLPGGMYADWNGTSGAAPLVAGVAALIRSKFPGLSAAEVVNRIVDTAQDAGAPGFDTLYGYGVLDVAAAVADDVPVPAENRLGSMAEWIQVYRRGEAPAPSAPPAGAAPAEIIPMGEAPQAQDPRTAGPNVPALVVLGFGGLVFVLLVGGTLHVLHVRRSPATARPTPEHR